MRILVRGQARSGTSIMASILTRKPHMFLGHELHLYDYVFRMSKENSEAVRDICKQLHGVHASRMATKYGGIKADYKKIESNVVQAARNIKSKKGLMLKFEQELFGDYEVFGDKVPQPPNPHRINAMLREGIDFKIIWMYRDGRDVVASKYRHKVKSKSHWPWATTDIEQASNIWAENMIQWDIFYEDFKNKVPILCVRFEDMIDDRENFISNLAEFVEIDESLIAASMKEKFSTKISHKGYHQEWIPSWEDDFVPTAKMYLEKLGYIDE